MNNKPLDTDRILEIVNNQPVKIENVVYVDGNSHTNMNVGDAVILDKNLLNYPLAHKYILNHELGHVRKGFFGEVWMELKNDVFIRFSNTEKAKNLKKYQEENPPPKDVLVMNMLRGIWIFPVVLIYVGYVFTTCLVDILKRVSDKYMDR